jgi:hypothetical protein
MKEIKVKLTFVEPILGTAAADPEIHSKYIASLAPDAESKAEEVARLGVDEVEDKALTVFPRTEDGEPFLWDYQVRGFIKESAGILKTVEGSALAKNEAAKKLWRAHKKNVDNKIFVKPRQVVLNIPEGKELTICQRPLRASTPMGERVALSASEELPAGTTCEFSVVTLEDKMEDGILECLTYGMLKGIGQWRNSGKGRFTYEVVE